MKSMSQTGYETCASLSLHSNGEGSGRKRLLSNRGTGELTASQEHNLVPGRVKEPKRCDAVHELSGRDASLNWKPVAGREPSSPTTYRMSFLWNCGPRAENNSKQAPILDRLVQDGVDVKASMQQTNATTKRTMAC